MIFCAFCVIVCLGVGGSIIRVRCCYFVFNLFIVCFCACCYLIFARLKSKSAGASKKSAKAAKDPNKPKRPASAFFVFMYLSFSLAYPAFFFLNFQIRVLLPSRSFFVPNFYCLMVFVDEYEGRSSGSSIRRSILITNLSPL